MPDALDVGLTELCRDLDWARAEERGEVEYEQPRAPGVYTVNDAGELEYVGSHDQVRKDLAEEFAQAVIEADAGDYYHADDD